MAAARTGAGRLSTTRPAKRDMNFTIRISTDELALMDEVAERLGVTRTDAIMDGLARTSRALDLAERRARQKAVKGRSC